MLTRCEVFVSAASRDWGTIREFAAKALSRMECHPVSQGTFGPDCRNGLVRLGDASRYGENKKAPWQEVSRGWCVRAALVPPKTDVHMDTPMGC